MENQQGSTITAEDFARVEVRVGRVLSVELLAGARQPAYKLRIDFGYQPADLEGRLVLGVVNLLPRRVAGFNSEALTLGVADEEGAVVLLAIDPAFAATVPLGARVY